MGASGHWFGRRVVLLVERRVDMRLVVVCRYAMLGYFVGACAVGIVHGARYLPSTFESRRTYSLAADNKEEYMACVCDRGCRVFLLRRLELSAELRAGILFSLYSFASL